jgi:choline dehydrogenase
VFLRGLRRDFERWSAAAGDSWSFDAVLPAFLKLENDLDFKNRWHGDAGPIAVRRYAPNEWMPPQMAFVDACLARGFTSCPDANEPDARGIAAIPFNNVGGVRGSTLATYLAMARARSNLTIHADTLVRRLSVGNGYVSALEAERRGVDITLHADRYVLSAGVIGSPSILQRSGIGPAGALRAIGVSPEVDLPGVGSNLADHQLVDLVWEASVEEPHENPPRVQVALRCTSSVEGAIEDDLQVTVRNAAPGYGGNTVSLVPSLELPIATGSTMIRSNDPLAEPDIELRFLSEPADLNRLREGVELSLELAAARSMQTVLRRRISPADHELDSPSSVENWLMRAVRTSHHACGTCRMGASDDPSSVVGSDCAVHGVENLYVADASIFPTVIGANPNASVMMVGEHAAELLAAR